MGPLVGHLGQPVQDRLGRIEVGEPLGQVHAPYFRETRVIRRITESVKLAVRWERGWGMVKITP